MLRIIHITLGGIVFKMRKVKPKKITILTRDGQ